MGSASALTPELQLLPSAELHPASLTKLASTPDLSPNTPSERVPGVAVLARLLRWWTCCLLGSRRTASAVDCSAMAAMVW